MSDEIRNPDEQIESLPEKQAEEQVAAEDAESVKGGIIVQGGLSTTSPSISSTSISSIDPSITEFKFY
ncbi:MAG: hypothetical protein ACJ8AO_05700 [Gemmatimonadaceae bacterium]